ncbi:MAG TPA: class II aldolase/adducin family protein [Glaciibacter sp.]|nr:class II aldolase/adducin family protein [Glaciibacter sp.]
MNDDSHTRQRAALVSTCRHLAACGLSPGSSGNVSLRVGDILLMTPTGSALSRLTADGLSVISLPEAGAQPVHISGPRPSKELPLHLAVYGARPDARAVVHLHSPYATALSCLPPDGHGYAALPPITPYRVMRLGDVPVAAYQTPGSDDLAIGVAELARGNNAMLLASHGPVLVGGDLASAADLAEELETAAQLTFLLQGTPFVQLTDGEVASLRSRASPSV